MSFEPDERMATQKMREFVVKGIGETQTDLRGIPSAQSLARAFYDSVSEIWTGNPRGLIPQEFSSKLKEFASQQDDGYASGGTIANLAFQLANRLDDQTKPKATPPSEVQVNRIIGAMEQNRLPMGMIEYTEQFLTETKDLAPATIRAFMINAEEKFGNPDDPDPKGAVAKLEEILLSENKTASTPGASRNFAAPQRLDR